MKVLGVHWESCILNNNNENNSKNLKVVKWISHMLNVHLVKQYELKIECLEQTWL